MVDTQQIIKELAIAGMQPSQPVRRTGNSTNSIVGSKLYDPKLNVNNRKPLFTPKIKPLNTVNKSITPTWSSKSE